MSLASNVLFAVVFGVVVGSVVYMFQLAVWGLSRLASCALARVHARPARRRAAARVLPRGCQP